MTKEHIENAILLGRFRSLVHPFFPFFLMTRMIYERCNDLIFNFTNNSANVTFKNVNCHILPRQSVIRVELRLFCESFEQMKSNSRNKFGSEIS